MFCANCGKKMKKGTKVCPECGTEVGMLESPLRKLSYQSWVSLAMMVVGVLFFLIGLFTSEPKNVFQLDGYYNGSTTANAVGAVTRAGEIAGVKSAKAIYVVGGTLLLSLGALHFKIKEK